MKAPVVLWLSAVCLTVCTSNVVGDYILEVRTHNYSNPNSLLATASVVCCDESCGMPSCDNIFYYCLRSLGTSNKDGECSGGNRSHVNYDDAPLNFSQSTVLGLPNPLPLRGLTRNWTGVQFFLEVVDYGGQPGTDALVGKVVYDLPSSNITIGVETKPQNFSHKTPPVRSSIVLSFKVVCAENFYGPDCSRLCTENCTCDPGFTGEFCHKIDNCYGVDCGENRQCVDGMNNHTCVCNPGYTGENCNVNIDDCQRMIINCSGRGQCFDGINTFTCVCDAGYTGEHCEVEINYCQSLTITCSENGQCVNEGNSYRCVCNPYFTGETCSDELLPTTETETEAQAPDKNINLKAILGGAIGALVFLILLLLLIVGALAVKLSTREQKTKGKHHALSASTDALEMEENETYIVMTSQVPTETINNSAYEGVTSNSEETEGATHYTNGDFQVDTNIYECI